MKIIKAEPEELDIIKSIVDKTIDYIYPRYYPQETIQFFLSHHSKENILADILKGDAYVLKKGDTYIGTGSVNDNYIGRVYILPEFQGKGFGKAIMDFLEDKVFSQYPNIILDTSLPAYKLYLKRGYSSIDYQEDIVENDRVLCYHIMEKKKPDYDRKEFNLDGKKFRLIENSDNGETSDYTIFSYYQKDNIIWADYAGGNILKGNLLGKIFPDNHLEFNYIHINQENKTRIGKCESYPEILGDKRIRFHETWEWLDENLSQGKSIIEEIASL